MAQEEETKGGTYRLPVNGTSLLVFGAITLFLFMVTLTSSGVPSGSMESGVGTQLVADVLLAAVITAVLDYL